MVRQLEDVPAWRASYCCARSGRGSASAGRPSCLRGGREGSSWYNETVRLAHKACCAHTPQEAHTHSRRKVAFRTRARSDFLPRNAAPIWCSAATASLASLAHPTSASLEDLGSESFTNLVRSLSLVSSGKLSSRRLPREISGDTSRVSFAGCLPRRCRRRDLTPGGPPPPPPPRPPCRPRPHRWPA